MIFDFPGAEDLDDVLWGPSMSWSNQLVAMIPSASWIPAKSSGISNSAPSATVDGFNVRGLTATTASGPSVRILCTRVCVCVCVCISSRVSLCVVSSSARTTF